jgi:hypothetical protein
MVTLHDSHFGFPQDLLYVPTRLTLISRATHVDSTPGLRSLQSYCLGDIW